MSVAAIGSGLQADIHEAQQQAKLAVGAKDFEAMMLEEMLKPLKFGQEDSSEEDGAKGASGTTQGFATEAMAKGLAAQGGFGIAKQIIRQISAEHEAREGKKVGTKVW